MKTSAENKAFSCDPEKSQKTLCIVQLTRMGDLLQTLQAVQVFKEENQDVRLLLVARATFAKPIEFLLKKVFDKLYLIETAELFSDGTLEGSTSKVASFLKTLNSENITLTINYSFSKSSGYLCGLIKSTHHLGPRYDSRARLNITDKWSKYVYSTVMAGPLNPFSMVDIFHFILGTKTNNKLQPPIAKKSKHIVIHPFSSHEKKNWKISKWAEIIYKLLKDDSTYKISLVGSPSESERMEELYSLPLLQNYATRITNLVGKTSIQELSEILKEAQLFVGHDSMVGHLSSIMGTQTLTISLGTVRPYETTPYGIGNFNIKPATKCFPCFPKDDCAFMQCHADVPYQVVCSSIHQIMREGQITADNLKKSVTAFHLNSVKILRSDLSEIGRLKLVDIFEYESTLRDISSQFYRVLWLYFFNEEEENNKIPELSDKSAAELSTYLTGIQSLYELYEFSMKYCRYILEEIASATPNVHHIKEFSKKIDEIDRLQHILKQTYPLLSPLVDYFTVSKANIPGKTIVDLTESAFLVNSEAQSATSVFYELVEKTIAEHKIKQRKFSNIKPTNVNV